jgi:hypothetical protein
MSYRPLQRPRPSAVVVLGILHLVGGGLDLLATVCGGVGMAVQDGAPFMGQRSGDGGGLDFAQLQKKMQELPGYQEMAYGGLGANLLLGFMLLAAGVGLLNMQPWARTLSLVYAPLAICDRLVSFFYSLLVVLPGVSVAIPLSSTAAQEEAAMSLMRASIMIGVVVDLLFIAYPIMVLVILTRAPVVAAFRAEEPPQMDLPDDEGWGAMKPRAGSTDVTDQPEYDDRGRFPPPQG